MASGELEKSLRAEIDNYIGERLSGLKDDVARLQSQVNEAFTRLLERSSDETQTDTSMAVSISEHIRAAHERGIEDAAAGSTRTKASSDVAILKAAIDDLDDQRSQVDILKILVNRAASFAPRVVFFVVKNEQASAWRARGLEGTVGDSAVRDFSLPLSSNTLLGEVVSSRATWSGAPGSNADDHLLLAKLGGEPPQRMIAIPLVARERTVAALYADSAGLDADAINLEALEALARVAGMAVELLALTRPAPAARPARVEQPIPPARPEEKPSTAPQTASESSANRIAEAHDSEATLIQEREADWAAPEYQTRAPEANETPVTQTDVAYTPEATPAPAGAETFEVAAESEPQPAIASPGQYSAPLGTSRRYGSAVDIELPVEVSDEERRLHNDARRFARLLVSEIKLYNEQKVKDGRTEGDLYHRLREDIDRSRQMYDKRVAPPVAARYDYFHQEVVNTLAEGDPSKLGAEYPGATVPA